MKILSINDELLGAKAGLSRYERNKRMRKHTIKQAPATSAVAVEYVTASFF